jgi:hypothetical protein
MMQMQTLFGFGGDYDDSMPPGAMWSTIPGAGHMIADDLFNDKLRRRCAVLDSEKSCRA